MYLKYASVIYCWIEDYLTSTKLPIRRRSHVPRPFSQPLKLCPNFPSRVKECTCAFNSVQYPVLLYGAGIDGKSWRLIRDRYDHPKCKVRAAVTWLVLAKISVLSMTTSKLSKCISTIWHTPIISSVDLLANESTDVFVHAQHFLHPSPTKAWLLLVYIFTFMLYVPLQCHHWPLMHYFFACLSLLCNYYRVPSWLIAMNIWTFEPTYYSYQRIKLEQRNNHKRQQVKTKTQELEAVTFIENLRGWQKNT